VISNSDLRTYALVNQFYRYHDDKKTNFKANTIDYDVAPDLCIGYQYLSLGYIQLSTLFVSHFIHSSFKYDSTLPGHAAFLQLGCFCMPIIYTCIHTYIFSNLAYTYVYIIWKIQLTNITNLIIM